MLGDSVTSVGRYAFYGCLNLGEITIPESVAIVGEYMFAGCTGLKKIFCEAAVPRGWGAGWDGCSDAEVKWGLNNVVTNAEYDYVEKNESIYLTGYKGAGGEVEIPSEIDGKPVVSFGEIFTRNIELTGIILPDSIKEISSRAFYDCWGLKSITMGSKLTSIGKFAFWGCRSLLSVTIPNGVTTIEELAFGHCGGLTSIVIPSGVTTIGEYAFHGCDSLTSIAIPSSVTTIANAAFHGCSSLREIVIPKSVKVIAEAIFYMCSSLTNIYCEAGGRQSGWNDYWLSRSTTIIWGYKG